MSWNVNKNIEDKFSEKGFVDILTHFDIVFLCEKGRYHNIEIGKRIYQMCDMNDVEDEYHFILKCPFYTNLRHLYILRNITRPNPLF